MFTMRPVILDAEAILAVKRPRPTKKDPDQAWPFVFIDRGEVYTTGQGTYNKPDDVEAIRAALCNPDNKPLRIMKCVIMVNKESCPPKRLSAWEKNFDKPKNIFIDVDTNEVYVANGSWLSPEEWDATAITNLKEAKEALEKDWDGLFQCPINGTPEYDQWWNKKHGWT